MVRANRHTRGRLKKKRTRREEAETMKNFIEEDELGIFATKTKRRSWSREE